MPLNYDNADNPL